jgi:DNA (cytosine-5)-methyltransferase 1
MNPIRYSSRPIAVEFFAGAGGLSLGLEQAGFDVVLAVDRDGYHVATHERNFPHGRAVCASVTDLDGEKIRALLGSDREIDLVAGGPPCQGFSHMGTRDVSDPRNSLVGEFVRLVLELRPKAFLMENVPGMQSGSTAAIFEDAIARLENEKPGYVITRPVRTLNAADFGVPQSRERLFVLGLRSDIGREISYPVGLAVGQPARPTVDEAIGDLPRLSAHPEMLDRDWVPYDDSTSVIAPYARVLRGIDLDPSDYSHPRIWDRTRCTCSSAVRHRPDIAALYAATRPGEMVPGHKLPKLLPSGLAPTLRAGSESEHGSYTAPRPVHPHEPRCITAREAARLHGYPDWFRFYPGKWHAYRQIGNSVCPPVARRLGRSLLAALELKPKRPTHPLELPDDFSLPEARPRQHRRITQLSEWPKVLERLLRNARNERGRLVRPEFSVADVEKAYAETGANMPRNPARRFLSDLARSRNVDKLLKPIGDAGLTIVHVGQDGPYGRFVPKDTEGAIDAKETLAISSRELPAAITIRTKSLTPLVEASLASYLERRTVGGVLFGEGKVLLNGRRNLLGELDGHEMRFTVLNGQRRTATGPVIISRGGSRPTLSQLSSLMNRSGDKASIVMAPITRQHLAVFLLGLSNGRAVLRRQQVFRIVSTALGNGHGDAKESNVQTATNSALAKRVGAS